MTRIREDVDRSVRRSKSTSKRRSLNSRRSWSARSSQHKKSYSEADAATIVDESGAAFEVKMKSPVLRAGYQEGRGRETRDSGQSEGSASGGSPKTLKPNPWDLDDPELEIQSSIRII